MSRTGRATAARWGSPRTDRGRWRAYFRAVWGARRARAAAIVAVVALSALAATVAGPAIGAGAATTSPSSTSTTTTLAPTTLAPTTTIAPVPAVPAAPTPGGSVGWAPQGRAVLGRPLLYTGSAGGAFVAWMDPQLVRPVVVPGTGDPGGPWPWGGQVAPDEPAVPPGLVQRGLQVERLHRRRARVRQRVPRARRGAGVVDRLQRRIVHRRRVGPRHRSREAGRRGAPEPAVARRRRTADARDRQRRRVGRIGGRGRDHAIGGGCRRERRTGVGGWTALADRSRRTRSSPPAVCARWRWTSTPTGCTSTRTTSPPTARRTATASSAPPAPTASSVPTERDFVAVMVRGTVLPGATAQLGAAPIKGEARRRVESRRDSVSRLFSWGEQFEQ